MPDLKINSYPLHIGDWHSGTSRMSLAEAGAYIRLCNQYYLDNGDGWTVNECLRICAAMAKDEQKAVKAVLTSKFEAIDGGYRHAGMDKRIAEIKAASERNQERARVAAEKRWGKPQALNSDAKSNATSIDQALHEECHPKAKSQKPVIDGGGSAQDELGWPLSKGEWVDILTAETLCGDIGRDLWLRRTSQVLVGWHQTDRFHWDDVVAGVKAGMVGKANDPPSSWKYFSQPIARAKRDRETPTPEAKSNERRNPNYKTAAQRGEDSTISAFGRVFADLAAGEIDADGTAQPDEQGEPLRIASAGRQGDTGKHACHTERCGHGHHEPVANVRRV